jgi:hypothetical protein
LANPQTFRGNAKVIYDTLVNSGATPQGARGILAGLMGESRTLDPEEVQPKTGAYGIGQWLGDRQDKLTDYADRNELEPDDINTQSNFLVDELQNNPSYAKTWREATNPGASAQDVLSTHVRNFERPYPHDPAATAADIARRSQFLGQQPPEITPAAFHPIAGNLSDIPGGNLAAAPPLPQPPTQPYALPPGAATAAPAAPPAPVNPPYVNTTGPRGSGDVVVRPDPTRGATDPNMPVVGGGGLGPTADPDMNEIGDWRPQLHGQPAGYRSISGQASDLPPSKQTMLAAALAQGPGQGQTPPPIDPAMLALALQGNGAAVPGFSGGFDFGQ